MAAFVRGLAAAVLASLFGAGHGRGPRGSAGCQQAQDAFGSDAQLLQITVGANSTRSVQWTILLEVRKTWGARLSFAGQMAVANGIMAELQAEAVDHISRFAGSFTSVAVQGGVSVPTAAPDSGRVRVFVLLPVSGVPEGNLFQQAFNGGLEQELLTAFRTENWGSAFLYQLFLQEGDTQAAVVNSDQAVTGKGDPHLVNIRGQRFDLYQPGIYVLLQVPRRAAPQDTLLRVEADARRMGAACADLYFQALNITGSWSNQTGGLRYLADVEPESRDWRRFGTVDLKVVRGRTLSGIAYLNVFVKHLGSLAYSVGGLLGEDDHTAAATPGPECSTGLDLHSRSPAVSSFAITEG